MIIDKLIYDRTQEDVEYAQNLKNNNEPYPNNNLRFSWDFRALNRTEEAMQYVNQIFQELGYFTNMKFKTDWSIEEITPKERDRYINNLTILRNYIALNSEVPLAPTTINGMSYERANDIEKILFEIDKALKILQKDLIRSGVANCGQNRTWQYRFRDYTYKKGSE